MIVDTQVTRLQAEPEFDLEEFMNFAHETRIASETFQNLLAFWEDWGARLEAHQISSGKDSWLAIWLPEDIEQKVDEVWAASPGDGFLMNNLAQYLCMAAANALLPQIADGGCAPAPKPAPALAAALEDLGLGQMGPALARRYALLTYYPFRGGCEICSLQEDCPRNAGEPAFSTVTLPGYERGRDD